MSMPIGNILKILDKHMLYAFGNRSNIQGKYFRFRWSGTYNSGPQPMLEGYEFPDMSDQGYVNDNRQI